MVTVERITNWRYCGPVVELMATAPTGELPFGPNELVRWARDSLHRPRVVLLLFRVDKEPAGFLIAFQPWELESTVFAQQGYVAPRWRDRKQDVLRVGVEALKELARLAGAKSISFVTARPRAWERLFGRKAKAIRSYVEV